jgi:hypothetical protein
LDASADEPAQQGEERRESKHVALHLKTLGVGIGVLDFRTSASQNGEAVLNMARI